MNHDVFEINHDISKILFNNNHDLVQIFHFNHDSSQIIIRSKS